MSAVEGSAVSEGRVNALPDCKECAARRCFRHCSAETRQAGSHPWCQRPAGHSTDHPGIGHCKLHGGNTTAQRTQAHRVLAARAGETFGLPREIDPRDALLEEVHRTAGHVAWLNTKIASFQTDNELKQLDTSEKFEKPAVWVELYQVERKHLVAVAKAAADAGVEERRIKLAEVQGEQLAAALKAMTEGWFAALLAAGVEGELLARIRVESEADVVRRALAPLVELDAGAVHEVG